MSGPLSISASGLAASAAQFSRAAGQLVRGLTSQQASPPASSGTAQPAPVSPTGRPAAPLATGGAALAAQSGEPESWMVEILKAKAAYRANADAYAAASQMQRQALDIKG